MIAKIVIVIIVLGVALAVIFAAVAPHLPKILAGIQKLHEMRIL
jgi:hypothetical protein